MPEFTLSARPLKTLNVMRLPMLSDYVHAAVADVLGAFIAPNAFTLDAARLIMGQDVDLNTESQGVAVVVIHSASGLSDTDHGSKSDPFVLLTWSKLGKIMHVTRVIRNELNPRWEEVACVPVPPDAIREGERLSLELWDSDKITADECARAMSMSQRRRGPVLTVGCARTARLARSRYRYRRYSKQKESCFSSICLLRKLSGRATTRETCASRLDTFMYMTSARAAPRASRPGQPSR